MGSPLYRENPGFPGTVPFSRLTAESLTKKRLSDLLDWKLCPLVLSWAALEEMFPIDAENTKNTQAGQKNTSYGHCCQLGHAGTQMHGFHTVLLERRKSTVICIGLQGQSSETPPRTALRVTCALHRTWSHQQDLGLRRRVSHMGFTLPVFPGMDII